MTAHNPMVEIMSGNSAQIQNDTPPTPEQIKAIEGAFSEGFVEGDVGLVDPDPKPDPDPNPDPAIKTTPDPNPTPDPEPSLADVTKLLKQTQQTLVETQERTHKFMRDMGGRLGAVEARAKHIPDPIAAPVQTPSKKQITEAMKSADKFKELTEDFPLWGEAQSEILRAIDEKFEGLPGAESLKQLEDRLAASTQQNSESTAMSIRELVRVDIAFPGWEDTLQTEDFTKWFNGQPEETLKLADSDKAADAIKLLTSYSEHQKASAKKIEKQQRLKSGIDPDTGGHKPIQVQKSVDDAFSEGFRS